MRIADCLRRVYSPLLIPIAFALLATPCFALPMDVTVGFGGTMKSSYWTPIAVKLVNSGDENVDGVLVVEAPEGMRIPMPVCTEKVILPAHSTKLYHAYIRLAGYGGKIKVSLGRGYGVLAAKEINVTPASNDDRLIVSIGDRSSRLSFMENETIQIPPRTDPYGNSSGPGQATIHAGALSPAMLPDRPAAYEGADVLVISGLAPDSTSPSGLKAICMWVASGGTLVVSTGPDYRAYTNAFYGELLPVSIQGASSLPGMPSIASLGGQALPAGSVAIAMSALKPGIGHAVVSESGVPIVAERNYGAGRVIFLAFDLRSSPFKDWNGQTAFWKSLIKDSSHRPIVPTDNTLATDPYAGRYSPSGAYGPEGMGFAAVVMQHPSVKIPSTNTIGFFLVAYLIVLVPVNYFLLRRKRKLELAWVSTPAIVLLFTVGAYAMGYTMKGGALRLSEAVLVEGSSSARYARVVSDASVFSPARRSYNLTVSDPYALSQMVALGRDEEPPVTFLGETSAMEDVGIAMWSSRTFQAVGGVDLGGTIEAKLKSDGGELRGEIRNNTGVDLKHCFVFWASEQQDIGKLGKGQVRSIRVAVGKTVNQGYPGYGGDMELRLRLHNFMATRVRGRSEPILIGFADGGRGVIDTPEDHPVAERSTCYAFHLDYDLGASISIPPVMIGGRVLKESRSSGTRNSQGLLSTTLYAGGRFVGSYALVPPLGFEVTALNVVGSIKPSGGGPGSTARVQAYIRNWRTSTFDRVRIPSGNLPHPGDYVAVGGEVRIRIENDPPGDPVGVNCGLSAVAKRR